jgi:hypothetical protein
MLILLELGSIDNSKYENLTYTYQNVLYFERVKVHALIEKAVPPAPLNDANVCSLALCGVITTAR